MGWAALRGPGRRRSVGRRAARAAGCRAEAGPRPPSAARPPEPGRGSTCGSRTRRRANPASLPLLSPRAGASSAAASRGSIKRTRAGPKLDRNHSLATSCRGSAAPPPPPPPPPPRTMKLSPPPARPPRATAPGCAGRAGAGTKREPGRGAPKARGLPTPPSGNLWGHLGPGRSDGRTLLSSPGWVRTRCPNLGSRPGGKCLPREVLPRLAVVGIVSRRCSARRWAEVAPPPEDPSPCLWSP